MRIEEKKKETLKAFCDSQDGVCEEKCHECFKRKLSKLLDSLVSEVADSAPEPFTVTSMEDYCRQFEQWKKKIKEEKK